MRWEDQGALHNERYTVVPRTLIFVSAERHLLLLRGSPHKRIWPNQLNGIGGHLEPGEHPLGGALRELREEAGLDLPSLDLRGLIHVAGRHPDPGVLLFVFTGEALSRLVRPSHEGALEWHPLDALPYDQMVPDLPHLLPLLVGPQRTAGLVYGHYALDAHRDMHYRYQSG
ncbi:MAG: NUDIX domain-containing protein [Anaerolineae bacterium]|jgi:8-oxo-dGTP diphosphatase